MPPSRSLADALAAAFDFSRHYLGRYFKRHYQENLGDYVARCRIRAIQNALALCEDDATQAQQLLRRPIPAVRRAEEAVAFLQRIAEIESRIHALLEGSLTANLAVGAVAWRNP